uniref:Uncharacterized protein n=1 Tax=Parascaris univalens TaxID=6257 RepID=A0A915A1H2_PARUN
MKKSAKGFGYVEDETTTTTKTVVTVENDGMNAQQKRGASASLARKSATEYNYDESDDELTTTTKTVTTTESSGGAPRVPLHQTQSYGLKKNAENYSFEDERTTAAKVRYDMPPGSIDPLLGERQKGENYLQSSQVYGRNEAENLLGRHSSLHVHQSAGSTKNYLDRDSQLSSSLMRSTLNPQSKKRRFGVCDLVFFVLAPCFILLILVAVLITLGVA